MFKIEHAHLDGIDRLSGYFNEHKSLFISIDRVYAINTSTTVGLIKDQVNEFIEYLGEWLYDNRFDFDVDSYFNTNTQLNGTTILLDDERSQEGSILNKALCLSIIMQNKMIDSFTISYEQVEQIYSKLATEIKD